MTSISSLEMYFGLICLLAGTRAWVLQTGNGPEKASVIARKRYVGKNVQKTFKKNVDTGVEIWEI
jgi:hypothetical protein